MKHRKLFPASGETNSTVDCPDFCDPSCPFKCYPYSDYFFLPPPPPPPPTLSYSFQGHHISPHLIIIVSLLVSFFLLVSYYVVITKSCPGWCSLRNNRMSQPPADSSDEEFQDENQVDHPIWFITTVGLQQSIINSITVCKYKKDEGLIEGTECSVCLGEFRQDETLRLLPKCNHAFHISCIDTWLRSHTNCPLCRAHIVSEGISTPLVSANHNRDNLDAAASNQMENSQIDGDLGNIQEINEVCEVRTGAEGLSEISQVGDERNCKDEVNCNDNGEIQVPGDPDYLVLEIYLPPMRRSFSMDSSTAATIHLVETDHSPSESEESLVTRLKYQENAIT